MKSAAAIFPRRAAAGAASICCPRRIASAHVAQQRAHRKAVVNPRAPRRLFAQHASSSNWRPALVRPSVRISSSSMRRPPSCGKYLAQALLGLVALLCGRSRGVVRQQFRKRAVSMFRLRQGQAGKGANAGHGRKPAATTREIVRLARCESRGTSRGHHSYARECCSAWAVETSRGRRA